MAKKNNYLKALNNSKIAEKEKVALSLNETYGKLLINGGMAYGDELNRISQSKDYNYAKTFVNNHYHDLDNAIILELAISLALNKEVRVNFVPSKTEFVDMELDFVPIDDNNKDAFSLIKFDEKGEKQFEKNYTKAEAEIVKAERNAVKKEVEDAQVRSR